jgi:hypothetical protein
LQIEVSEPLARVIVDVTIASSAPFLWSPAIFQGNQFQFFAPIFPTGSPADTKIVVRILPPDSHSMIEV